MAPKNPKDKHETSSSPEEQPRQRQQQLARKEQDLTILYDVYDLKAHSKIKCGKQIFTVSELLDYGWTIDQIVKQRYI